MIVELLLISSILTEFNQLLNCPNPAVLHSDPEKTLINQEIIKELKVGDLLVHHQSQCRWRLLYDQCTFFIFYFAHQLDLLLFIDLHKHIEELLIARQCRQV